MTKTNFDIQWDKFVIVGETKSVTRAIFEQEN